MAVPDDDPLRFDAAIEALRAKVVMTDAEWEKLIEGEREFAFTVANVSQADVVAQVFEAVERAVTEGTTLEAFKADVGPALEDAWGGEQPGRIENIFRTNVQGAYNAGRYREATAPAVRRARPYWRFDGVNDARTTEDICLPIVRAKVVLPADHPWWRGHYPPLHFQCRSIVTPLSESEAKDHGVTGNPPDVHVPDGFGKAPSVAGADWEPDPEADYPEPIAAELDDKLSAG